MEIAGHSTAAVPQTNAGDGRRPRHGVAPAAPPAGRVALPAPSTATVALDVAGAGPLHVTAGTSPLTRREIEVLRLVAAGLSNPVAAARLLVDVRTVETHLTNMGRKLHLPRRALIATARDLLAALPSPAAPPPMAPV